MDDTQTAVWDGNRDGGGGTARLQGGHVVEGMVQLLANGFVLELLSIQFVWRSEVDPKVQAGAEKSGRGETRGRWQARRGKGGKGEDKQR